MAAEPPRDPLGRVESLMEIIDRAHMLIFTRHRRALEQGRAAERVRALLQASASITFRDAPEAARAARLVVQDHAARQLLDPATPSDEQALERSVNGAELALTEMLRRQQQIADELTTIIGDRPER